MNARILAGALAVALLTNCKAAKQATVEIPTVAVERRDIVLDATASGTVEPINVVEVKSKSSGQITRMTVETGSIVNRGELLVQLDTRDVQNQYDQAKADLDAAEARLKVTEAQKKRSDELFQQRIITAQEYETSQLDYANAQASVVRARTTTDIALQRLEDATVTAPVYGTIIEKSVSLGQVITSATSSASGGTTILKMADLGQVRMRALFNETDIGSVQAGQEATVTVDAYPDRPFRGTVEKIEPQAVVQQSVTMFPVLVTLANREGLLKPGMTGEASVLVDRREAVLAIPNDAVRNVREGVAAAEQLGLNQDSVQAEVQRQMAASFGNGMGGMAGGGAFNGQGSTSAPGAASAPKGMTARESRGEVALATQQGVQQQLPEVTDQQCQQVRDAFAKQPDAQGKLQALFQRMRAGELDMQQMRTQTDSIYKALGVDGRVARACQMRDRGGQGGGGRADGGGGATGRGDLRNAQTSTPAPNAQRSQTTATQQRPMTSTPVTAGEFTSARSRARPALVFVQDSSSKFVPRVIRTGAANLDYTEVVSGLKEGERVAMIAVAQAAAQRAQANDRMRSMSGGAVPGMTNPQSGPPRGRQ